MGGWGEQTGREAWCPSVKGRLYTVSESEKQSRDSIGASFRYLGRIQAAALGAVGTGGTHTPLKPSPRTAQTAIRWF